MSLNMAGTNVSYHLPEIEYKMTTVGGYENYTGATMDTEYYPLLRHPLYMVVIYSLAYTIIMIVAIVGNLMVVMVVARNKSMHTVINFFIVNLAIADIMVALICLPMTLFSNLYHEWHFGWFMCKATPYLQGVSVCASVNTLAAIAVDRYLAICRSMEVKISRKGCKMIIVCIWAAAFTIMIPWAIYYQIQIYSTDVQNLTLCYETWPSDSDKRSYFLGAIFLCCYTVPLTLIVACYFLIGVRVWKRRAPGEKMTNACGVVHKSKVKAVKMLAFVVVVFAFSWLPLYVIRLTRFYGVGPNESLPTIVTDMINPIAQWLGSSNSGMNPIIYCFFSKRYRTGFKDTISCCKKRDAQDRRIITNAMTQHTYSNGNTTKIPNRHYLYQMGSSDRSFSLDSNNHRITSFV